MERNYYALQRFYQNAPLKPRRRTGGGKLKNGKQKLNKLKQQKFRCADCAIEFKPGDNNKYSDATRDHIIPHRFGSSQDHNIQFVCMKCNQTRDLNTPEQQLKLMLSFFGSLTEPD